jgi:hypothetical protein
MKRVFCLLFPLLISCSNKYHLNRNEILFLNKEIDEMYDIDQSPRLELFKIDSIYKLEQFTYMKPKQLQMELLGVEYLHYKNKIDSLWIEIRKNDTINTIKLLKITERYGFPNNKRLNVYQSKAYLIFVHAPRSYFDPINEIIEKEYSESRISEYEKEYIFWHTKYERKGMPPMCGENGEAIKNAD